MPPSNPHPFSLLIKPAGPDCNLRCAYCFYLDHAEMFGETNRHRMSEQTLETMIRSYMATPQPQYAFGWQGGEPTLMGTAFFQRVTELQQQYGPPGASVSNGLQTNGTLIDDAMAAHLAKFHFLVGLSVDGPAEIHNRFRRTAGGEGSHALVMAGLDKLRRHAVEFNILTLVSQSNVGSPETVYRYLRDELGVNFHQYIECVEFDAAGQPLPFSISGAEWGEFLVRIFDLWYAGDTRKVSVRLFDTILAKLVDNAEITCASGSDCRQYFVVEHNGDIYPCDFFVYPEWRLGNVAQDQWNDLWNSPLYERFGRRKREWNPMCAQCPYLRFCHGDCPKNRTPSPNGAIKGNLSHFCAGWLRFYKYALPRLEELAQDVRRERRATAMQSITPRGAPPRRNDPCPCGSGRKFKHCCGKVK